MGTDLLNAPGYCHQITPVVQQAVVSAVLPFACETPHGYVINIMVQPGASGSPAFTPDSGDVIGVLYGSIFDFGRTQQKDVHHIPTNFSLVVAAHYLKRTIADTESNIVKTVPQDTATIDELIDGINAEMAKKPSS